MLLLLAALGCGDKDLPVDDSQPVEETGDPSGDDSDEPEPPADEDRDGYTAEVDCDDNNFAVFPGAPEACDGLDNDCDRAVDEDHDADGDGAFSALTCAEGEDCDDQDAAVGPGAPEVPYDGVDQDCSGADLIDVDGDGFVGAEAGGADCDDADPAVFPGAQDIPLDGVDQDCSGADSADGDGDGFDAAAAGGDDCDDADPAVFPGALDLGLDGVDADCDGRDSAPIELADSATHVQGTGTRTDLVGRGLDLCDLDEDGLADLVIGAPFLGTSYTSAVGIWYGRGWSTWSAGMDMSTADTLIQGAANYSFIGFETRCGDFDGDGHQDLLVGRGEIDYAALSLATEYSLLIFNGDGRGFGAALTDADADATLSVELGPPDAATVYSSVVDVGDADGDGADDILLALGNTNLSLFGGEERVVVVPGAAWTGDVSLLGEASRVLSPQQPAELNEASVVSDLDGDGHPDLVVLSAGWSSDWGDTFDTGGADEGRTWFIGDVSTPSSEVLAIEDLAGASLLGRDGMLTGLRMAEGDFTGDGVTDLVISALGDSPSGREGAGGIFLLDAAAADLSGPDLDLPAIADAEVWGEVAFAYLGYSLSPAGDMNGDGAEDLLVAGPGAGLSNVGELHLVSGAHLTGVITDIEDIALLTWRGESSDSFNGFDLVGGQDIDGDGLPDAAFVASGWDASASSATSSGRVYVFLSGQP